MTHNQAKQHKHKLETQLRAAEERQGASSPDPHTGTVSYYVGGAPVIDRATPRAGASGI